MILKHKLNLQRVTQTLESTPKTLAFLLAGVDETVLNWHPAEREWSIKEIIGHLIACDQHAFAGRIELMLREDNPVLPRWDMPGEVVKRRDNARPLPALLDELAQPRLAHAERVRALSEEDLTRPCQSRVGTLTIGDFVFEWAYHDLNHIAQIATNLKMAYLPLMGDTMRQAVS